MRIAESLPPVDVLRELLRYDQRTGRLFWRKRPRKYFNSDHACNAWNGRHAGRRAFVTPSQGYMTGKIFNENHRAARVAWAIHHGVHPTHTVDHEDGNRANDRMKNLRDVPHAEQQKNLKKYATNKSGEPGVGFDKRRGKWRAYVKIEGADVHLGYFEELPAAIAARRAKVAELGFHKNHGRAA